MQPLLAAGTVWLFRSATSQGISTPAAWAEPQTSRAAHPRVQCRTLSTPTPSRALCCNSQDLGVQYPANPSWPPTVFDPMPPSLSLTNIPKHSLQWSPQCIPAGWTDLPLARSPFYVRGTAGKKIALWTWLLSAQERDICSYKQNNWSDYRI